MWRLVRLVVLLVVIVGVAWFGSTVQLGKHTLFGHLVRIWHAQETQDLVEGARETAGPSLQRFARGFENGLKEARDETPQPGPGVAGAGHAPGAPGEVTPLGQQD